MFLMCALTSVHEYRCQLERKGDVEVVRFSSSDGSKEASEQARYAQAQAQGGAQGVLFPLICCCRRSKLVDRGRPGVVVI